MKFLNRKSIKRGEPGVAELVPEESEDIWHLYNIASKNDHLKSLCSRKVRRQAASGAIINEQKKFFLTVCIQKVEYDPSQDTIRFTGYNVRENEWVKMGQYHTTEIGIHSKVSLRKNCWDVLHVDMLMKATDPHKDAEVGVILIENGLANMYLLTASLAKDLGRIQQTIPKNRELGSGYKKAVDKFHKQLFDSLCHHFKFDVVKVVLLAGPGLWCKQFYEYLQSSNDKAIKAALQRNIFVVAHASSAWRHSLDELLGDPKIQKLLNATKAGQQTVLLEQFYKMLHENSARACYGPSHVSVAAENNAIDTLLITNKVLRSNNLCQRVGLAKLVERLRSSGKKVEIFSDQHVSGEKLNMLSGIAAILAFPVYELQLLEEDQVAFSDDEELISEEELAKIGIERYAKDEFFM
eukprot:Platyproteum_vivax@DN4596_c0_g1_i1.p1